MSLVARLEALTPRLRAASADIEQARRLPPELAAALAEVGAFRMLVPSRFGGGEVEPEQMVRAIELVARADSAAGWCVMVGATTGLAAAFVEPSVAAACFGATEDIAAGVFAPMGQAARTPEGWRVRGRWSFASGVENATCRMVGCVVVGADGAPELSPEGAPRLVHVLLAPAQTRVVDTWKVSGLLGTGSHDLVVEDAVIPEDRGFSLAGGVPRERGVLYRFPMYGLLSLGIAGVALGIAREAIDALVALAGAKKPQQGKRTLAHRELVQAQVAEAEALLRSARAFLFETTREVTERARTAEIGVEDRALLRLAATTAVRHSARAVDLMYEAGGGSAIYATSPLQRHFRDVHVATQHMMVAPATYALTGRVLLGLPTDAGSL